MHGEPAPRPENLPPRPPPLPHRARAARPSPRGPQRMLGLLLLLGILGFAMVLIVWGLADRSLLGGRDAGRGTPDPLLLRALAIRRLDVVFEGDRIVWTDGGDVRYTIRAEHGENGITIATPDGDLAVDEAYFVRHHQGPPPSLPVMLAVARDAGLAVTSLRASEDPVTGPRLASGDAIVLEDGVLQQGERLAAKAAAHHNASRSRLAGHIDAFLEALERTPREESVRKAAREILGGLTERNGRPYWGSLQPDETRRLVRHGWLAQFGAPAAETAALERAVEEACRPVATRGLAGAPGRLTTYENAFGHTYEVFETRAQTRYTCPQPKPQWLSGIPDRQVVIRLAPGSDPLADTIEPLGAEIACGSAHLGTWRRGGRLEANAEAWQGYVRGSVRGGENTVDDLFPPHVLVTNAHGDVHTLITPFGILRPARDGSPEETKRFLDEAVAVLPNAAYLDLIGEVLYAYAWDTTAYDRPLLVGTQNDNGDIHQTAAQTLATCAGGTYRGDCDDLACFYHALARHQGRNAHVLQLPWHLACAWADRRADGTWISYVLHTGPPFQFVGADLESVLRATYASFHSQETIDLQALPCALRFGDDAVRQTYQLPGEIFADKAYAEALIAVQAAYRDHTYLSGVDTMRTVLAQRARVTAADHREIAHLLNWAQRYEQATPAFEAALAQSTGAEGRVDAALDLLVNLVRREQTDRIGALVDELIQTTIPRLESARGQTVVGPWLRLATALLDAEGHRLEALRVLTVHARARTKDSLDTLRSLAANENFDPQWLHYNGLPLHETNVNRYIQAALGALAVTREEASEEVQALRRTLDADVRSWFQDIGFRTIHTHESPLARHGLLAAWYATRMGEEVLAAAIESAGPPTAEDCAPPRPRSLGTPPDAGTLRLMSLSPEHGRATWWRALAAPAETYDAAATARALRAQLTALDRAEALGLAHWSHPPARALARLALAVVERDLEAYRAALAAIAARHDHGLQGTVATILALAARHMEAPEFAVWLAPWAEALDHPPHYFQIAWSAVEAGRLDQALEAAALAVARHPEYAPFQSELEHLRRLAPK